MTNIFKFYSVLKNEDAVPYVGDNVIVVADGLGGSGSSVHVIDREKHQNLYVELVKAAFGDITECSKEFSDYMNELLAPMADEKPDTSALWASRIVIARCAYAITQGEFKDADLSDKKVRATLVDYIMKGLHDTATALELEKGKYDGQLLLPTTLAFIRYTEQSDSVIAEVIWAGDSRCYALTPEGLKQLSVDDEDASGTINNLFYADNKKATLHYIRHEIKKPCALFAVSDGVFDPFEPNDNLGVESTLFSCMKESASFEEFSEKLKEFYDGVHGDDATMTFVSFGLESFGEMQDFFSTRATEILSIREKQGEMYSMLEVADQTEEEASHYVVQRVSDRYDYIVPMIVEAVENSMGDIAVTEEVMNAVSIVKKNFAAQAEQARKEHREKAMDDLYGYVQAHPELVNSILKAGGIDFEKAPHLQESFMDMKKYAAEYVTQKNIEIGNQNSVLQLNARMEELHLMIKERIDYYRRQFDDAWGHKNPNYKERYDFRELLQHWEQIDFDLQYGWGLSKIGQLPKDEQWLAFQVRDFIGQCKSVNWQINSAKTKADSAYRLFGKAWSYVYNSMKKFPNNIYVLLTPEIIHQFGLDVSDESFAVELSKGKRDKLIKELKANKTVIAQSIVSELARNYDKSSVIDSQFNPTKLQLFRVYYRMQANPNNEVKAFEARLEEIEKEYMSLINE